MSPKAPSMIEMPFMNLKLVVAISALAAMPAFAQSQPGGPPPNAPKPTMAEVQKVVQIISGDKTKTQQYCDLGELNEQMAQAEQKNDTKTLEALSRRADDLAQKIGPEYLTLIDGLGLIDENSSEGKQIVAALDSLDELCTKK
jgi:hypothetical protein